MRFQRGCCRRACGRHRVQEGSVAINSNNSNKMESRLHLLSDTPSRLHVHYASLSNDLGSRQTLGTARPGQPSETGGAGTCADE